VSILETSTEQILEAYKSAVWARDVDAFMRLYDPKVGSRRSAPRK